MAEGIEPQPKEILSFILQGNETQTITGTGFQAIIFCKRSYIYYVAMIDFWTEGAQIIATSADAPTITHAAGTLTFSIKNNYASALSVQVIMG